MSILRTKELLRRNKKHFLLLLKGFQVPKCFRPKSAPLEQAPAIIIPFLKVIESISKSSYSHPFEGLPFFYYIKVIAATHSFKLTVFLQNKNCSREILEILITIPPWYEDCIY